MFIPEGYFLFHFDLCIGADALSQARGNAIIMGAYDRFGPQEIDSGGFSSLLSIAPGP
jgi:hypothetical protein